MSQVQTDNPLKSVRVDVQPIEDGRTTLSVEAVDGSGFEFTGPHSAVQELADVIQQQVWASRP